LVNIHTDPDDINTELDVLATVLTNVRAFEYQQAQIDDVMLLGDLNAAPGKLRGLERIQGTVSVINIPTNTRRDKVYDNIILDRGLTSEFTGRAGTIDLQSVFGIGEEQALKISDHMPIWAEFYMQRSSPAALSASQPTGLIR
jgi:deoxyribonuclease-1-like protein